MRVGVLALQGAFREHCLVLERLGAEAVQVRKPEQLEGCEALIIPGGESTAIGKLMNDYGLFEPIRRMGEEGAPIFGTCAGMVLLAREIEGSDQPRLGLMNIGVSRNAFGRQVESFEAELEVPVLGPEPLTGVFIRAPQVVSVGPGIEVLAQYHDKVVLVRQGNMLAASFHPELTEDSRLHEFFLRMK